MFAKQELPGLEAIVGPGQHGGEGEQDHRNGQDIRESGNGLTESGGGQVDPGPPAAIARATPAILPRPTVPDKAAESA